MLGHSSMRSSSAPLLPLVLLALVSGCRRHGHTESPDAGTRLPPAVGLQGRVTVRGSDSLVVLAQRWAELFMKEHPGVSIQVTGGGSGTGLAALINGTTDIAMSSRPLQESERQLLRRQRPEGPVELAVARDGITFYVNEANPVQALSLAQLAGIYQGDITRWQQVGGAEAPIVVYSRESSSGTSAFVKETVLGGQDFTERAQALPGTAAVVDAVAHEHHGIGYGGAAYVRGVKALNVRRQEGEAPVPPTAEHIQDGTYPLSRTLYFYLPHEASGVTRDFLAWVLSLEGQQLVTQVGYFPVK